MRREQEEISIDLIHCFSFRKESYLLVSIAAKMENNDTLINSRHSNSKHSNSRHSKVDTQIVDTQKI